VTERRPPGFWWTVVAIYTVVLFAVQSRLGFLVDALKERWGVPTFERFMLAVALGAGAIFLVLAWRLWSRAAGADRGFLVLAAVGYAVGISLLDVPQERLHYVEYGVLAGLIYFAARAQGLGLRGAAVLAFAATSALGYLDEVLQGALWERRYFDWRDVQLNVQAAVLGTLAAVPVERTVRTRA
jgi:hypothetical protein